MAANEDNLTVHEVEEDASLKSLFCRGFRIYDCRFRDSRDESEEVGSTASSRLPPKGK